MKPRGESWARLMAGGEVTLDRIEVTRKVGSESFHREGKPIGPKLSDFWAWYASDLVGNALRGVIAEYLVALAVGAGERCRVEWDACDVITTRGTKVEVKSAAYVQTWKQDSYSGISFDIRKTKGWDADTNKSDNVLRRRADVYVFCLLSHKEQATINPLNIGQWEFFVLPTAVLDREVGDQKKISLNPLLAIGAKRVEYDQLKETIETSLLRTT